MTDLAQMEDVQPSELLVLLTDQPLYLGFTSPPPLLVSLHLRVCGLLLLGLTRFWKKLLTGILRKYRRRLIRTCIIFVNSEIAAIAAVLIHQRWGNEVVVMLEHPADATDRVKQRDPMYIGGYHSCFGIHADVGQ